MKQFLFYKQCCNKYPCIHFAYRRIYLQATFLEIKLLDQVVCALLILQVTVKLLFIEVTSIYSHQMCMRVSFPHTHKELLSVVACPAQYMKNDVIVLLISISTVMTEVEHVLYDLKRNQSTEHFLKHLKVIFFFTMNCLYPLPMILLGYWSFSY